MSVQVGANVQLGSIHIYGDLYRGPGEYHFHTFDWNDQPDVRSDDVARPLANGNFPPQSFLEAKDLRMAGFLVAKSHALLVREMNRMYRLRRELVRLTVREPGLTTWGDVEVRKVRFDPLGFAPEASFQIDLHMPDPVKTGASETFASGEVASHRGNYESTPILTVTTTAGMPSGYRINGPDGKHYIVAQALTAGQVHEIDLETGWLYRNGVLQPATAVSRAETWVVPAGPGFPMTLVPVSGSGVLAARVAYKST